MDSVPRESDLGRDVDIWPGGLPGDLDPVRERGGGGLGPAAPAVLRDVLVLGLGQEVPPTDVSPEPARWRRICSALGLYEGRSGRAQRPGLVTIVMGQALRERNHERETENSPQHCCN